MARNLRVALSTSIIMRPFERAHPRCETNIGNSAFGLSYRVERAKNRGADYLVDKTIDENLPRRNSVGRVQRTAAVLILTIAVVAVIAFPGMLFSNPGTNDAIVLADAEWPLLLLVLGGVVVVYIVFRGEGGTVVRMSSGAFLFGVAVALVVGLLTFGNTSNDRFGQLLFFPPIIGLVGLVGIVVAVAAHRRQRQGLIRGAFYGLALAVFFGAVLLTRGARDWLLAPYGFDFFLLMLILGAVLIMVGARSRVRNGRPRG